MTKAELLALLNAKKQEARSLVEKPDATEDEIKAKQAEIRALNAKIELVGDDKPAVVEPQKRSDDVVIELSEEEAEKRYNKVFAKMLRNKQLSNEDTEVFDRMKELRDAPTASPYFQSDVDENGGVILPKDVSTRINEYLRSAPFDLTQLVDVEIVGTLTGERVFEKLGTIEPFANIDEWETIEEIPAPQFEKKSFKVGSYAGILPIPRTLLQDTDQNLLNYVAKYIAKKRIITRNAKILSIIKATYVSKVAIATVDDVKNIVNVTLDSAFLPGSSVVTNQDGFNFLDKLKDINDNYLLQLDVKDPTQKRLNGLAVKVIPNSTLASTADKAPIFIGNFKEAIKFFDRNMYEILGTDIGGKSFLRNSYDIRIIDRFDAQAWDKSAIVAGEIELVPTEPGLGA